MNKFMSMIVLACTSVCAFAEDSSEPVAVESTASNTTVEAVENNNSGADQVE